MEGNEMVTYEVKTFDLLNAVAKFNRTYNALGLPVAINGCGRMYIKEAE